MKDKMKKILEKRTVLVMLIIIGIAIIPINTRYLRTTNPEIIFEEIVRHVSPSLVRDDEITEKIIMETGCKKFAVGSKTVILQLEESVRVLYFDEEVERGVMIAEKITPTEMEFKVLNKGIERKIKTTRYTDHYEAITPLNYVILMIAGGLIILPGCKLIKKIKEK